MQPRVFTLPAINALVDCIIVSTKFVMPMRQLFDCLTAAEMYTICVYCLQKCKQLINVPT